MLQSVYKLQNNAVKNALLFLVFKKYLLHCMYIYLGLFQVSSFKVVQPFKAENYDS